MPKVSVAPFYSPGDKLAVVKRTQDHWEAELAQDVTGKVTVGKDHKIAVDGEPGTYWVVASDQLDKVGQSQVGQKPVVFRVDVKVGEPVPDHVGEAERIGTHEDGFQADGVRARDDHVNADHGDPTDTPATVWPEGPQVAEDPPEPVKLSAREKREADKAGDIRVPGKHS